MQIKKYIDIYMSMSIDILQLLRPRSPVSRRPTDVLLPCPYHTSRYIYT